MLLIHLNLNDEVTAIKTIINNANHENIVLNYEYDNIIGYYTVLFDNVNDRFIISWYVSQNEKGCFYNEYKYYKHSFTDVKQYFNELISNNINKWR